MKKYISVIIIVLIIVFSFSFSSLFFQTGQNTNIEIITINTGESAIQIVESLRDRKVIKSRLQFRILLFVFGLQDKIQAGKYSFDPHQTAISVIFKLHKGETISPEPIKITFPEGSSIYKMGSILEKAYYPYYESFRGLTESTHKISLSNEFLFLKSASKYSLEGFLFPDTYIIEASTSPETLAKMMLNRFTDAVWGFWLANKNKALLGFYDTLILASIIEKEAQLPEERPIIASVFYNRLKMKMPLGADPTIKYALERPTKHVYLNQLNVNSPYNTYKRRGLPPTPICNPGLDSFRATIFPAKTDYIYFVARSDGSHIFSASWEEHQKARINASKMK